MPRLLSLIENHDGRWYFGGYAGIPFALSFASTITGAPASESDAKVVQATKSLAKAGLTTRYFPDPTAATAIAKEAGFGVRVIHLADRAGNRKCKCP